MNILDKVISVAGGSSSDEERMNAMIELINHYGYDGYEKIDADAQKFRKNGAYGIFAEFLAKNVCLVNSHQSNISVWNGNSFSYPSGFLHSTGREKRNADFLFKLNENVYEVCSCKMTKANTTSSISVSDVEINEELTKVIDVIHSDCSNPVINGIIITYSTIGEIDELARRCKNAGYNSVNIISMNPSVYNNVKYIKKISKYSNLKFTSFDSLWKLFVDIVVKSYNMDMKKIFRVISHRNAEFIPRVKQEEMASKIASYLENHDICGLSAICRFGKTATVMYAIKKYYRDFWKGKVVSFISFYPNNFEQQIDDFKLVFGAENVNVSNRNAKEYAYDENKINVVVISVQYSSRNELTDSAREYIKQSNIVIYDEAHIGFGSDKQQEFISFRPNDGKVIVISATPYTMNLMGIQFFSFTDYEKFMCDVNGNLDYYYNPNVIHVGISGIMDKKTREKYTWETCDELIHCDTDNNRALYSVLNTIIEKGFHGISLKDYISTMRNRFDNYHLYDDEPKKRYLNNFIIWCNGRKDIPVIIDTLNQLKENWKSMCDIKIKFSVSEVDEELSEYYEYYEKNSLTAINNMFSSNTYSERRVLNFYICVDMNSTGCTIKNADADIHLHDGKSFNEYEQKVGRIKERTFVKNYSDVNNQYSHFTFSFDTLKNRMLNIAENNVPHTERGNVDKENNEFKYINVLYGYMDFYGMMEIPSIENFICDMISANMKNFSERLTNKEFIYRSFLPTGNLNYEKFNVSNFFNRDSSRTSNDVEGNEISFKNVQDTFTDEMYERFHLTNKEERDKIKNLKNIAFIYSEFLKKVVFFMPRELMELVDSGEVNFFDAVNETLNHIKVNRIYYE